MTKHITDFVNQWTFENVNVEHYEPGDNIINPLVEKLIDDARANGISIEQLGEVVGQPRDIIEDALSDRMEEEKDRWMDRNP